MRIQFVMFKSPEFQPAVLSASAPNSGGKHRTEPAVGKKQSAGVALEGSFWGG